MALKLTEVVPWGRLASEYRRMFALTPEDLNKRILDCGGGPSSFTAEMTAQGKQVVSCDPLYQFTKAEILQRIREVAPRMAALNEANRDNFLWTEYGSPAHLGELRMHAMRLFLNDYPAGTEAGRYITGGLPDLPLPPGTFDLALCSHFLFTYSEQFTEQFHLAALRNMLDIAGEVRVFPLLTAFSGEPSPYLAPVMEWLNKHGFMVEIRTVEYEFQKGGNQMLVASS
jgi:hypothetical protein